jgi:predicted dehydrogenase
MERKAEISRRDFLKGTAAAGASAAMMGGLTPARALGANDRIRVGTLGTGERCKVLMRAFKEDPSVDLVACADVYGVRRDQGLKLCPPEAKGYNDYRAVLDRKDIDVVIIGSPDHWHIPMVIDALQAGKDVYVEKPVMHSVDEGVPALRLAAESKRVVATGTQQRSWLHYQMGKQIIDSGKLGRITFVHSFWYQDLYPTFSVLEPVDTSQLDWKAYLRSAPDQPFTLEKFYFWRWFWDFGGGSMTDLFTHLVDVIQWYMGQTAPKTATVVGDRYHMPWEAPDTLTATFEYPGNFIVSFTHTINSRMDDGGITFYGSEATLKVDREHLAVYPEQGKRVPGTFEPEPEIFVRSEHDGTIDNVRNFLECVRTRKTPNANLQAGVEAARTSWIGNTSLKRGMKVAWDPVKERVA